MSRYGLLALGGNLPSKFGTPKETIVQCIKVLSGNSIHIRAISRFYQTPCFPAGAGPDFVNAAVAIHTDLNPRDLLVCLHDIEAEFGRERLTRWGTRPLDIDLIALDDLVLPDADRLMANSPSARAASRESSPKVRENLFRIRRRRGIASWY